MRALGKGRRGVCTRRPGQQWRYDTGVVDHNLVPPATPPALNAATTVALENRFVWVDARDDGRLSA